jgi:hypothetical protein
MHCWEARCESCGSSYSVMADDRQGAIEEAGKAHDRENEKRRQWHCDFGPMILTAHKR